MGKKEIFNYNLFVLVYESPLTILMGYALIEGGEGKGVKYTPSA